MRWDPSKCAPIGYYFEPTRSWETYPPECRGRKLRQSTVLRCCSLAIRDRNLYPTRSATTIYDNTIPSKVQYNTIQLSPRDDAC